MQSNTISRRPVSPNADILPQRAISTAGHVGENAIKEQRFELVLHPALFELRAVLLDIGRKAQTRELGRIMVRHHHSRSGDAVERLVNEKCAPLCVAVVGDEEALGDRVERGGGLGSGRRGGVERFEELYGF